MTMTMKVTIMMTMIQNVDIVCQVELRMVTRMTMTMTMTVTMKIMMTMIPNVAFVCQVTLMMMHVTGDTCKWEKPSQPLTLEDVVAKEKESRQGLECYMVGFSPSLCLT